MTIKPLLLAGVIGMIAASGAIAAELTCKPAPKAHIVVHKVVHRKVLAGDPPAIPSVDTRVGAPRTVAVAEPRPTRVRYYAPRYMEPGYPPPPDYYADGPQYVYDGPPPYAYGYYPDYGGWYGPRGWGGHWGGRWGGGFRHR